MITRRQIFQAAAGLAVSLSAPLTALASTTRGDLVSVRDLVQLIRKTLQEHIEAVALFEPNDAVTRQAVTECIVNALNQFPQVHDYAVVCDETINTPNVIDRNELWVDVAVMPFHRSREFVYIPVRVVPS